MQNDPARPNAPVSFVKAMLDFFGKLPGQTSTQFAAELKALDDNDRAYFRKHLSAAGFVLADAA